MMALERPTPKQVQDDRPGITVLHEKESLVWVKHRMTKTGFVFIKQNLSIQ